MTSLEHNNARTEPTYLLRHLIRGTGNSWEEGAKTQVREITQNNRQEE